MTGRIVLDLDDVTDEEKQWALNRAVNGLREDDPMRSASNPVMGWQRVVLWTLLVVTVGFAIWRPMETAVALIGLCTFGYVFTMLDRVLIFKTGLASAAIVISDEEARAVPDAELPHYTILVPAYNEPEVVADLLGAMAALEYPPDKLQVLLLLEADDEVTITAAQELRGFGVDHHRSGASGRTPHQTQGLQLRIGVRHRGHRHDLRRRRPSRAPAAAPSGGGVPTTARQHRLRPSQTGLPQRPPEPADRMVHRRVRAVVRLPASRHDAQQLADSPRRHLESSASRRPGPDRGVGPVQRHRGRRPRLAYRRIGLSNGGAGLGHPGGGQQRPDQLGAATFPVVQGLPADVAGAHPTATTVVRTLGFRSFLRFNLVLAGTPIIAVLNLLFWFITVLWFLGQPAVVEAVFPWYIYFPALAALILGNGATLYMNLVALREDDRADLIVPALTVPAFFVMMSIAAAKGTYQLIRNPSYWEKTFHGLSQKPDAGPTGS